MGLKKYVEKRDFEKTNEPKGKVKKTKSSRFVIQHHKARADHYDFRLEFNGVLLSWAVPKGLSLNPKIKRLAVHVEDHPIDYIDFEGIIPKGNYGAGTVEIYDAGSYMALESFKKGLEKGHIKFLLNGEKLKGCWSLIKTDEKNWLIVKTNDEYAKASESKKNDKLPFNTCSLQLATYRKSIPTSKGWIYEIKYDGYRMVTFIENKKIKIFSRNGTDSSKKFEKICNFLEKIGQNCVLDGEMVVFDDKGRTDFGMLQDAIKDNKNEICYVVFDLLALNNEDLRSLPLLERKSKLERLVYEIDSHIIYSSHVEDGEQAFKFAKNNNLEGVIAKKKDSVYSGKRNEDWLKIKCYNVQEFVICGYTNSEKNDLISALILGYYKNNKLVYVGKVGTGFTQKIKEELHDLFQSHITEQCPFFDKVFKGKAIWLKPKYVAEIQFAELTKDNLLRQPSFISLRMDKKPKEIVLEKADE